MPLRVPKPVVRDACIRSSDAVCSVIGAGSHLAGRPEPRLADLFRQLRAARDVPILIATDNPERPGNCAARRLRLHPQTIHLGRPPSPRRDGPLFHPVLRRAARVIEGRPGRILIVDDQAYVSTSSRTSSAASDTTSVQPIDGAEALAIVRTTPPDAVLLDLTMPVMSGREH